jgi:signal transduction histidine kinase
LPTGADLLALAASGSVGLCSWTMGREHALITSADDTFLSLIGHTRESFAEAGTLDWRALTPAEWIPALEEMFAALLGSGSHSPREQEILSRNGDRVPVVVSSAMVDIATGAAVSVCIDLTVQVRARMDAERASQAKSRFLGVMSHELRTPLNTILGQTELIRDGAYGVPNDAQREALARLRGAGMKLRGLVEEVLLFSRLETGVEPFAVGDVSLAEALAASAAAVEPRVAAKTIVFELQPPPESCIVQADAEKLRLVLLALLSNAITITPTGGRITLNTAERAEISDYVFVRVSDTGSGVARERQEAIFEPFIQTDEGRTRTASGLGLGLAISRDLARGMGGDLRVRSTDGGGATFTLSLRRASSGTG